MVDDAEDTGIRVEIERIRTGRDRRGHDGVNEEMTACANEPADRLGPGVDDEDVLADAGRPACRN